VAIAFEQWHVPFDRLAEIGGDERPCREICAEEDGEVDIRLRVDAAEQRCLILDRVGDQIGEAKLAGHD
jgi:hypothetical protein